MKTLEEIERISFDQLEAIADDVSVKAPEGFEASIASAITAKELTRARQKKTATYTAYGILSAALASLLLALTLPQQPRDTFDDPALAYAEIEKAFSYMSGKMEKGIELASEANPIIEKTNVVFNR